MARVGFEQTFYPVTDNIGTVEICAVVYEPAIDCPIEFDFNVTFETCDGSAGTTYAYILHCCIHITPTILHLHFSVSFSLNI